MAIITPDPLTAKLRVLLTCTVVNMAVWAISGAVFASTNNMEIVEMEIIAPIPILLNIQVMMLKAQNLLKYYLNSDFPSFGLTSI